MSTCSTHVLDAALGRPAAGLAVVLTDTSAPDEGGTHAVTDADGRVRFAAELSPGTHRITFATGPWFTAQRREHFHPEVTVTFTVDDGEHYHVALLLSPFSYTTYRGS